MVLVAIIGDLHYPRPEAVNALVKASGVKPDLLILAGDFLDIPYQHLVRKFVRLIGKLGFKSVAVIMGNHEHYLSKRAKERRVDSLSQVERLAELLSEHGIKIIGLSEEPLEVDNLYIAGSTGWYDYTFSPDTYDIRDFENCNPYGVSLRQLELCERRYVWLCPKWWRRDCLYIRLPISNEEYVKINVNRVKAQLEAIPSKSKKIIVYHHVPRKELITLYGDERDFDIAYAGSTRLDEPVKEYDIKIVVYGHIHERSKSRIQRINGITYVNSYPYNNAIKVLVFNGEKVNVL